MKHFFTPLTIITILIGLTSCSEQTSLTETLSQESQLKSYSLTTAEDGSYILEHTLTERTTSTLISTTAGNEIILSDGYSDSSTKTSVLPLVNNEIKIDFISENEVSIPGIKILDEKITTSSAKKIDYVKDYTVSLLNDGSYELEFSLPNNYIPTYTFNLELNRQEIILIAGISNETNTYSHNFIKFEGEKLNIVFLRAKKSHTLGSKRINRLYYPEPPELEID